MKIVNLLLFLFFLLFVSGCDFFNETKKLKEELEYYKTKYEETKKELNRTKESYKRMWE